MDNARQERVGERRRKEGDGRNGEQVDKSKLMLGLVFLPALLTVCLERLP